MTTKCVEVIEESNVLQGSTKVVRESLLFMIEIINFYVKKGKVKRIRELFADFLPCKLLSQLQYVSMNRDCHELVQKFYVSLDQDN